VGPRRIEAAERDLGELASRVWALAEQHRTTSVARTAD
jgi:hypothetical protein